MSLTIRCLITLGMLFWAIVSIAQVPRTYYDVILKKDATVYRGEIIDSIPGVSVTFKTRDGARLEIARADIALITTEPRPLSKVERKAVHESEVSEIKFGFTSAIDFGLSPGFNENSLSYLRIQSAFGIGKKGFYMFGIGPGLRIGFNFDEVLIPVMLDMKLAPLVEEKVSPIVGFALGPNLNLGAGEMDVTSATYSGHIGVRIGYAGQSSFILALGLETFSGIGASRNNNSNSNSSSQFIITLGLNF